MKLDDIRMHFTKAMLLYVLYVNTTVTFLYLHTSVGPVQTSLLTIYFVFVRDPDKRSTFFYLLCLKLGLSILWHVTLYRKEFLRKTSFGFVNCFRNQNFRFGTPVKDFISQWNEKVRLYKRNPLMIILYLIIFNPFFLEVEVYFEERIIPFVCKRISTLLKVKYVMTNDVLPSVLPYPLRNEMN